MRRGEELGAGAWWLELMLRLHPRSFREAHSDEVRSTVRQERDAAEREGKWALGRFWLRVSADLVGSALRLRLRPVTGEQLGGAGSLVYDLRLAARTLGARPAASLPIVLTLGLGIGLASAMALVIEGVLLRPLPYPDSNRLVRIYDRTASSDAVRTSYPDFADWRAGTMAFDAMAGIVAGNGTVTGGAEPVRVPIHFVTADYFEVVGVRPLLGRGIAPDENREGGTPVAVVSERFWRESLGAPRELEGVSLTLADLLGRAESYAVVGVMPPRFSLIGEADVFAPLERAVPWTARGNHVISVVARIRADATASAARSQLAAVHARIRAEHPEIDALGVTVRSLSDEVLGPVRKPLLLLLVAAGILLLIAFINVAGALLARGISRRKELQVRAALGATAGRLTRQLLAESVLLALGSSAVAVLLAQTLLRFFGAFDPTVLPRLEEVAPAWLPLVGVAGLVASLGVSSFGLGSAVITSRWSLDALRIRGGGTHRGERRAWRALLSGEVALAFVLLVVAGLLGRSLWQIASEDTGFDARDVVTLDLSLPQQKYTTSADYVQYIDRVLARLRSTPGVETVGVGNLLPLPDVGSIAGPVDLESGRVEGLIAHYRVVDEGYFDALRVQLVRGRLVNDRDREGVPHAAVVTQSLARRLWGDEDPIGRRFLLPPGMDPYQGEWLHVVGVVAEARPWNVESGAHPTFYVSYRQRPAFLSFTGMTLVVRGRGPALAATALRESLRQVDPDVPVRVRSLEDRVASGAADRRFVFSVLTVFAALSLVLAGIGIWGVSAFVVSQRVREMCIRQALGAAPRRVRRALQAESLVPLGIGLAAGGLLAVAFTRWITSLLFEVRSFDPLTVTAAAATLALTSWLASYLPARRAARPDLVGTLRGE